jgi:hypothetical protein
MDPQQDKVLFGQATTIMSTSFKNAIGVYDISPQWLSSPASLDNDISAQTFSVPEEHTIGGAPWFGPDAT